MIKRLTSIALALFVCLALTLGMAPGVLAATVGMVIVPTPGTAEVGDDFTVDIKVTVTAGEEVNSAGAHLNFDTTYLEVVSITGGALGNEIEKKYSNAAGTIDYAAGVGMGNPPVTTDFVLATVTFHAKAATPGTTALTFVFTPTTRETSVYVDEEDVLDHAAVIDGTVNITGTGVPPVGGTAQPISKVAIVALWIALGAAIIVGTSLLVRRRRRAMR